MRRPFIGLCIASLVSFISARAEYSTDHAARMAAARAALERKLYELDHPPAQRLSATISVAAALQPVKPAINPTHTVTIKPAISQPSRTATTPAKATPSGADEWTQSSQARTRNFYAKIDFGGVYQQENTTLFQTSPFPTSGTASFNLGLRGNVILGYDLNKSLAIELDTGVLWNSMDKINGVSLDQPYPYNTSFETYTIPFLANVIYTVPLKVPIVPYIGAGVGGAASILQYSEGGTSLNDCGFVFAYQAEIGLKYMITKKASIGVAYAFLGSTNPEWHSVVSFNGLPPMDYGFKEKGFYTHSLVLSFSWDF